MGSMFPYSSMSAYLHHLSSSSTSNVTTNTQGVVGSPFWGVSDHEMHQAMGTNVNSSSIMSSHITNSGLVPPSSFQMAREGQIFSQLSMETQMYFHCDGEMEEEGIVDMEMLQNWVPPGSIPEYNEKEKEKEKEGCMKKGGVNSEGDEKREERGTKGMMTPPPRRIVSKTARDSPDSSYSSVSKRQRCALIIQSQQQQQEEKEEERGNTDMSSPLDENKTRTPSVSRRPSKDTKRSIITTAIDDQTRDVVHVRARRGQATDSHSLAERVRREKISQRMRLLQDLVPGCTKIIGKAMMLDEIINYVQCLQNQVEFLSMKLAELSPKINFDIDGLIIGEVLSNTYNNNNMDTVTTYKSSSSTSGGQVVVQGNMCAITYDPVCSNTMSSQSLLQTPLPSNGIFPPHQSSSVPLHAYNWQGFGI